MPSAYIRDRVPSLRHWSMSVDVTDDIGVVVADDDDEEEDHVVDTKYIVEREMKIYILPRAISSRDRSTRTTMSSSALGVGLTSWFLLSLYRGKNLLVAGSMGDRDRRGGRSARDLRVETHPIREGYTSRISAVAFPFWSTLLRVRSIDQSIGAITDTRAVCILCSSCTPRVVCIYMRDEFIRNWTWPPRRVRSRRGLYTWSQITGRNFIMNRR